MDKAQVLAVLLVAGVFISAPAVHGHSQSMLRAVVSPKGVIGTSGTSGGGGNFGCVGPDTSCVCTGQYRIAPIILHAVVFASPR